MATVPLLAARGVSKSFFGNPVLRDVSISLLPGRVHALLGENGAGKSTLINLLSGALQPDGGTIEIDGSTVARMTPAAARRAGIAVVQQELSLTGSLSIAENIGLGAYPRRFGLIDYRALAAEGKGRMRAGRPERAPVDAGRAAFAGQAADGRDRQGALSQSARPDPRRADIVAVGDRDAESSPISWKG